jgi:predicted DNA-binding transcriptional regulator AlpA
VARLGGGAGEMMVSKLQDTLIYARGLRADRAAAYLGMGKTKFLELVDNGTMPKAVVIDGIKVWDRLDLDATFEAAKAVPEGDPSGRNSFDSILKIVK